VNSDKDIMQHPRPLSLVPLTRCSSLTRVDRYQTPSSSRLLCWRAGPTVRGIDRQGRFVATSVLSLLTLAGCRIAPYVNSHLETVNSSIASSKITSIA
jgi:hypothetical protein